MSWSHCNCWHIYFVNRKKAQIFNLLHENLSVFSACIVDSLEDTMLTKKDFEQMTIVFIMDK